MHLILLLSRGTPAALNLNSTHSGQGENAVKGKLKECFSQRLTVENAPALPHGFRPFRESNMARTIFGMGLPNCGFLIRHNSGKQLNHNPLLPVSAEEAR
jgi:hypothetical protein